MKPRILCTKESINSDIKTLNEANEISRDLLFRGLISHSDFRKKACAYARQYTYLESITNTTNKDSCQ
jgi:hypothetical protein